MKKLLALLFTLAVAFSLSMPVFAQETGQGENAPMGQMKKEKKHKKEKKEKKKKEKKHKEMKENSEDSNQ